MAHLQSSGAQLLAQVSLSEELMPGVVSLPHGWGHDLPGTQLRVAQLRPGVNFNSLLNDQWRDPLSGNAVLSGVQQRNLEAAWGCAPNGYRGKV